MKCRDKVSWSDLASAERAARMHGQRVYQCPICGGIHTTKGAQSNDPAEVARAAEAAYRQGIQDSLVQERRHIERRLRERGRRRNR